MTRAEGENEESPPLAEPDDEPSEQVECGEHGAGEQRPGEQQTGEPRAQNPSPTTLRREAIAVAAIILSVVGFIVVKRARRALDESPTESQCSQLVDRHLEQAARQRYPEANARALAKALASARVSSPRAEDVLRCRQRLSPAQVACGLQAPNVDALERCLQ